MLDELGISDGKLSLQPPNRASTKFAKSRKLRPNLLLLHPTICIAIACLMLLALQGSVEWATRIVQLQATISSLSNLAIALGQQAEDTIEVADTAVTSAVARIETGTSPVALMNLDRMLEAQAAAGLRFRAIVVLDAAGNAIATSALGNGVNFADRAYFRHHRDNPDRGTFVGAPFQSRVTGKWSITVSRRFQNADGTFAGIVFAVIDLSYFVDLYATYNLGPGSSIALFATAGNLLARYPSDPRFIGRSFLNGTIFTKLRNHPVGNYITSSVIDGVTRIVAYRQSNRVPLVVVAAASMDQALVSWRIQAAIHMTIALAVSLSIGLLGLSLVQQLRRSQATEEALRKSEAFLDRAGRMAGVGGWELDLATNQLSWSAETYRIHRVEPGNQPSLERSIELYAPEAQAAVRTALERARQGGTGWDLDLRLNSVEGRVSWLRAVANVLFVNGRPVRVVGAFQDITRRVEEREALQLANERAALATDSGAIGLWDWDVTNNKMIWDAWMCRLHGLHQPNETPTYEVWLRRLHPDDRAAAEQAVRDGLEGTKPYITQFRVVWDDGSIHHIRGSGRVLRDGAGGVIRMIGANWDITGPAEQNRMLAEAGRKAATAAEQYRLLADNSTDMIFAIDRHHNRRYVSPASLELLGYTPEELVGGSPMDILHPDDAERVSGIYRAMFAGNERAASTHRCRHRNGNWVWVEAVFKLVRDPDSGAPLEICGSLRDVTQRVAAEAALRETDERYRMLLESGVAESLLMLDPDGFIESWNTGAERIYHYTAAEIVGRNFWTFFSPDDLASGEPAHILALAAANGRHSAEGWRLRKDATRFLAHIVIDTIRKADGTVRGFAMTTRDITDQRIEEEQRSIIIEAAPNGMMIVDEAGMITLANTQVEKIFDYPRATLVGQSVDIVLPDAFSATDGAFRSPSTSKSTDHGMAAGREFTGLRRDGTSVSIEILLSPVKTPRGAIVVASLTDITERLRLTAAQQDAERSERLAVELTNAKLDHLARHLVQARDRAEEASQAKSRFLAGMSHELRTPLNGILGYAQLLQMDGDLNATQSARLQAMLGAGKHLLQMITCVLDLSEIEANHVELQAVRFDVKAVAEACLDLVRPAADAKGLSISVTMAPGTRRELIADPTRLRQVLLNLLGNAAKFTSHGSIELRLRPTEDGSALRIEIVDTGAGIPADQRRRLFQDFERMDTEATRTSEGAGLGLALSARLAKLMGGRLGHDDNPGGGSVFWLELPLNTAASPMFALASIAELQHDEPATPPARGLHVLVVDDVLMNREIASSFLVAAGHTVTSADSGAAALIAVSANEFDVILMDVRMPLMDGLEATRRIRDLKGPQNRVPIIALTAQAFTDQIEACRQAGMDSHLAKPFEIGALLTAVARAYGARSRPAADNPQSPVVAPSTPLKKPSIGSLLPVLNPPAFQRTAAFLEPSMITVHLQTITDLSATLLAKLRAPDSLAHNGREFAELAHSLAGSAGMFGFERLAALGRAFERAAEANPAEAQDLADEFCVALEATRQVIHDHLADGATA